MNSVPAHERPFHVLFHLLDNAKSEFLRNGKLGETPKLIRDNVLPDSPEDEVRHISRDEALPYAMAKLFEELGELLTAETPLDVLDEAADLIEAIHLYVRLKGAWPHRIEVTRSYKARDRGAFDQLRVWEGRK